MILNVEANFSIFMERPPRQDHHFNGFTIESLTSMDLFQCKQNQGEALRDYF
jgi:hypothetical protein